MRLSNVSLFRMSVRSVGNSTIVKCLTFSNISQKRGQFQDCQMFELFTCQYGVRLIPLKLGADRQKLTNTSQIRKYDFTGRPTYKTLKRTVQPGRGKVHRLIEKRGDTTGS